MVLHLFYPLSINLAKIKGKKQEALFEAKTLEI